jgi:DNA primase
VAFGGRVLSGEGPKYINSSETELFKKGRNLFAMDLALPEIRNTKTVILAEGYMDVLALHQAGALNAVAPLGTAFTDEQARLVKRWADRLILMLDADEAGQNAVVKAILTARKNGLECHVVVFPRENSENSENPKDPAEILQKNGVGALQKLIKCSILDFDYLLSRSKTLSEDKSKAAAFLFPYFAVLDSEISRDSCIGITADEYGIDRQAVWDDYKRYSSGNTASSRKSTKEASGKLSWDDPLRLNGELYLLTAVFLHPGFFKELRAKLDAADVEDHHARELFIVLEEWFRNSSGEVPENAGELFSALKDEGLRDFVIRQGAGGAFVNPEKIVHDGIVRVKGRVLERRMVEIVRELRSPGTDGLRQGELLAEKIHIDSELSRLKEADI